MSADSRGSIWRKWDVHIHTPASVLESKFPEDWDEYVKALFQKAILHDIGGIGITDYYLLDGYKRLRKEYLGDDNKLASLFSDKEIEAIKKIYVFPNLEFRLRQLVIGKDKDLSWNRKLNFHVLLSDALDVDSIESDFLAQLHFEVDATPGAVPEQRSLNRRNLEEYGRRLKSEHLPFANSGHSDLFIGMLNASVEHGEIAKVLGGDRRFDGKYMLGLPADEDLSEVHWNSQGHGLRKTLIKLSSFIMSSNPRTVGFLLGGDDRDGFEREFGPIKPCIWGSDAHSLEDLFLPDNSRFTWIKADQTFEGIKQVIYDPESRISIQEGSPQNKAPYRVISRIRFLDRRTSPDFSSQWIDINPDLTTIIGGKSSGKSLLLHHIARAANSKEVDSRLSVAGYDFYPYSSFKDIENFDFEVVWGNGDVSLLSDQETARPITYIPQLYINHLAEDRGREQLNELVEEILSQDDGYKGFLSEARRRIRSEGLLTTTKISELYAQREQYAQKKRDLDAIGAKDAIISEVASLTEQIEALKKVSGFSDEELAIYERVTKRIKSLSLRADASLSIHNDMEGLITLMSGMSAKIFDVINSDASLVANMQSSVVRRVIGNARLGAEEYIDKIVIEVRSISSRAFMITNVLQDKRDKAEAGISHLVAKIGRQSVIVELQKRVAIEESKLKSILILEEALKQIQERGSKVKSEISDSQKRLSEIYDEIVKYVEVNKSEIGGGINISAEIVFRNDIFEEFLSCFDRRTNLTAIFGDIFDEKTSRLRFDQASHGATILGIFEKLKGHKALASIRKGITEEELTKRLFADCYGVDYKVHYKGDEVLLMSPGKKGLVLMSLMLHLCNEDHPILIDQPEDNLDNRTIYDQLNYFIREAKKKRQIIMVTHNANLVVSADAECVLVANQSGQSKDAENAEFRFEYVGGALERTFNAPDAAGVLNKKGIREHVCEILEGGRKAFEEREKKYGFKY